MKNGKQFYSPFYTLIMLFDPTRGNKYQVIESDAKNGKLDKELIELLPINILEHVITLLPDNSINHEQYNEETQSLLIRYNKCIKK